MIIRRIRGVLTAATMWGLAFSLTVVCFTAALFLVGAGGEPIRRLPGELADMVPMAFGMGVTGGALFALVVIVASPRRR